MLLLCWYNVLIYKSLRLYFLQLLNCFLCHAATDPFGLQIFIFLIVKLREPWQSSLLSALQAATILVAMASEKNFWRPTD